MKFCPECGTLLVDGHCPKCDIIYAGEKKKEDKPGIVPIDPVPDRPAVTSNTPPSGSGKDSYFAPSGNRNPVYTPQPRPTIPKKRTKYCRRCGGAMGKNVRRCPYCGKRSRKPLLRRFWFWVFVLVIGLMIYSYKETGEVTIDGMTSAPRRTAQVVATPTPRPTATPKPTVEAVPEIEGQTEPSDHTGLDPAFKATMDSYEAFFDEYIAFMENYVEEDGSDLNAMMDYLSMVARYAEMMEAMDAIDEDSLSEADLAYYLEVSLRIESKLLAATYEE